MPDGRALLDVQRLDTALDQLQHKLANMPERVAVQEATAERDAIVADDAADAIRDKEINAEQKRREDEVAKFRARIDSERERESTMTSPKELQAVEAEIASLERRIEGLEDEILELMEEAEPLSERREARSTAVAALDEKLVELGIALTVAEAELLVQRDAADSERVTAASQVDSALLAQYETLRESRRGVVVGQLNGHQCTACMLTLPPVEAERILDQPEGSVATCESCGGMIVR